MPEFRYWSSKPDIRKEVEMQVRRTMSETQDQLEVDVKREVSRQVNKSFNTILLDNLSVLENMPPSSIGW